MSLWTHITSCISVDTCIYSKDLKLLVEAFLTTAPKITGSEGDADVFVNIQSGHNYWTNYDCEHCEYRLTLRESLEDDQTEVCDAPKDHDCSGEYQSCVVISIQGDLRDRTKEQTQKEFDAFLKYIEDRYLIRDYAVNIVGD